MWIRFPERVHDCKTISLYIILIMFVQPIDPSNTGVQFSSVQSLNRLGCQGHVRDDSAEIPLPAFSAGGPCEQLWHGKECQLFDVVHPAFPLPTSVTHPLRCPEE